MRVKYYIPTTDEQGPCTIYQQSGREDHKYYR